jgi:hypothetical protein
VSLRFHFPSEVLRDESQRNGIAPRAAPFDSDQLHPEKIGSYVNIYRKAFPEFIE